MKITPIKFNSELRNRIKDSIQDLLNDSEEQDPRVRLTINCINSMNIFDRNMMLAYMFLCDYSIMEVAKLFSISRQAATAHIMDLNKQIQNYVKSHS